MKGKKERPNKLMAWQYKELNNDTFDEVKATKYPLAMEKNAMVVALSKG